MEISQIIYAVELAECLNFSQAAQRLYVTQPTISKQIGKLERNLGFSLFYRSTKNVKLTEAGEIFLRDAKTLLRAYRQLEDTCSALSQVNEGSVNLGVSMALPPYVTRDISDFNERYPKIKLNVIAGWYDELKQMLQDGAIDVASMMVPYGEKIRGLQATLLSKTYVCASVSANHRIAGKKSISLEDVAGESLILSDERSSLNVCMQREFEKLNLRPLKVMNAGMFEVRVPIILKEESVTFTTHGRTKWFDGMNIINIPVEPRIYIACALCTKAGALLSKPSRALLEALKNGAAEENRLSGETLP